MSAKSALTPDIPWPGAAPYGTADRAFFHGRKRETEELLRLIQRDVITLVMGAAGVGKTSLIQAGLLPALAESEWLTVVPKLDWSATPPKSEAPDLDPDAMVSLANPLARTLIDALLAAAAERQFTSPDPQPGETLWEYFHRTGNRWWSPRQRVVTPIVIIDGFESVFTTATENATAERHAAAFLQELSQLAANRSPQRLATRLENGAVPEAAYDFEPVPLRIVLVMRDEFASQLTHLRSLFPTLRRSELRLEAFTTSQARDVLLRGSLQVGLISDDALDAMVAHLASGRGAASEISPAKLSALGHQLALTRRERGVPQITPDFLPKQNGTAERTLGSTASPAAETAELREELAASESGRRASRRLALVAVFATIIAVAAPFVREQFAPPKAAVSDAAPAVLRAVETPSRPVLQEQPTPRFENPFSTTAPEFLPAAPATPATPATPAAPIAPLAPATPEPAVEEPPLPTHDEPHKTNGPPPRLPPPSALSPDVQRQLDAAAADRREQQLRREFLRRQQEGRRGR